MEAYLDSLLKCVLFKNMDKEDISKVLKNIPNNIHNYNIGDVIAIEGESCESVGIILSGNIEIHKSFASGKLVTINYFEAGNIFGEALVFSGKHQYPATIISTTISTLMFIAREDIVKLMTLDTRVLNNFMGVLSDRILMLNQRLSNLTLDTIRKKIANIILIEYNKQKTNYITLPYSRKKMAEMLNIPRPSLSRELSKMKEEGLIDFYKNKIKLINVQALEDTLSK
jgi:CRP-like cAMP-binding protein